MSIAVIITDHAYDRAKERFSLSAKSLDRMAPKALRQGIGISDCKGELKKYIGSLQKEAAQVRIYGEVIYLFYDNKLITVYKVPNEFKRHVRYFSI